MPALSVLIKPSSSNCNLKCKYCFYDSIADKRDIKSYGMMKDSVLENIVKEAFKYAEGSCSFAFQGGEPTLIGLDFYRKFIELQNKYNVKKIKVFNSIQTNGIMLDEEWAKFLHSNNFLVGVSLDGPKDINDKNRVDCNNKSSFNKVMKAISILDKHKVEYNILFVIASDSARHAAKIYSFFKKNNFRYIQFIPCLDPLGEQSGKYEFSLKPEAYAQFLKSIFDLWYRDFFSGDLISIRYFDNLVTRVMGYKTEACGMNGMCSCQFVIEADGGVYPCDFYVTDEFLIGNINNNGFDEILSSNVLHNFIEKSKSIANECKECNYWGLCRGGCRRNREPFENGSPVLNYFCEAYKEFFNYSYIRICEIAKNIMQR